MVLVPMKDARERSLAKFLYCSPSRNRLKSQYSCSLIDASEFLFMSFSSLQTRLS